ncbi:MAG: response regulator [Nitrospirae bacterium]|nr:response regulator [Nitrospirota bacterium]
MKPSILIVDDEVLIRDSLTRLLYPDYTIYQASNGREAIQILRENKGIELVLSDIKMPEMDGIELLETIRSDNSDMVVILMTAFSTIESVTDVKRKGAYDCLSKPLDLTKLEITIKNALGLI